MSGGALAFQKLNGAGTQMQNLIDSVNKSDLYRMAKEFAPNVNLTAVTKSWEIGINENAVNDLALGGLYFGRWILNHNSQDVGNNDNSRKRSQAFLKYGGDVVARTMIIVHGDDILSWGTQTTEHYGFATSLHVHKLEVDDQPQHGVQVSFIGYKISNDAGFVFPSPTVVTNPNQSGNIGLSAQDLTNAGYTYQWNVTTGTGFFVDPNNPNTQFVPDGNGSYVLELVVTDGDGNLSTPVVVPVEVQLYKVEFQNDGVPVVLQSTYSDFNRLVDTGETIVLHGLSDEYYRMTKMPYDHRQRTTQHITNCDGSDGNAYYEVDSFSYGGRFDSETAKVNFQSSVVDDNYSIKNNFPDGQNLQTGDYPNYLEYIQPLATAQYFTRHTGHKLYVKHNFPFQIVSENGLVGNSSEAESNIHYWESLDGFNGGLNPGHNWEVNPV